MTTNYLPFKLIFSVIFLFLSLTFRLTPAKTSDPRKAQKMDNVNPYDVFCSYSWRDRAAVEAVAQALQRRGLKVFLDRWYLVPGRPWPQALEEILASCRAVAVFVGPQGLGDWQQREAYLALNRKDITAVIPVLLPGADPALGFLSLHTWVDLRQGLDDPLSLAILHKAIRGEPPGI